MHVYIRPAALAEIDEAYEWYASEQAELGNEFLISVQAALEQIGSNPKRYPVLRNTTRRILLHRFPYAIYFRVGKNLVAVTACVHGKRNPIQWQSRR